MVTSLSPKRCGCSSYPTICRPACTSRANSTATPWTPRSGSPPPGWTPRPRPQQPGNGSPTKAPDSIGDPADEFGSDQVHLHHLWDENDITAAKAAGICVAHIDTHGRVEYYATTPRPWPWQPPAPRPGSRSVPPPRPDQSDTADNGDNANPAEDLDSHDRGDAVRHDAIAAFIRGADPEQSAEVLAKLTLLGWQDDEDQDLTARLLGTSRHPHWSAYRAELLRALTGTDRGCADRDGAGRRVLPRRDLARPPGR